MAPDPGLWLQHPASIGHGILIIIQVEATVSKLVASELLQAISLPETSNRAVCILDSSALPGKEKAGAEEDKEGAPSSNRALDEGLDTLVMRLMRTAGQLASVLGSFRDSCTVETKHGIDGILVGKLLREG